MKNLTKIFIICSIGIIVSLGLFFAVVNPTLSQIDDAKNQVSSKQSELQTLEEQIVTYKNSQTDLAQASQKDIIDSILVKRQDLTLPIQEIEQAAVISGVTESMQIQDPSLSQVSTPAVVSGKATLDEIPYSLAVSGNFNQLVTFMQYLEALPHFTEVSGFDFSASAGQSNSGQLFLHSGNITGTINAVFFTKKQ
jgi:Tfp pilus assembly protein PilO